MIWSKIKLGSELDRVKQLLIETGYPDDVLISCIKQKYNIRNTYRYFANPRFHNIPWAGCSNMIYNAGRASYNPSWFVD